MLQTTSSLLFYAIRCRHITLNKKD